MKKEPLVRPREYPVTAVAVFAGGAALIGLVLYIVWTFIRPHLSRWF